MRVLPRHGHVHFACTGGSVAEGSIDTLEVGDRVYLNCGGRLIPVTLIERRDRRCLGQVAAFERDAARGETVTFDVDDIYVVRRLKDAD